MKTLTESQIWNLHEKTEEILEQEGFRVTHKGILETARKSGASVDDAACRIRIPRTLLRELIAKAPSRYAIEGADGQEYTVGGESPLYHSIITDPYVVDYETLTPRRPCLEDVRKSTAIANGLTHISIASMMDFPVTDDETAFSSLRALYEHLLYFGKHIYCYATSMQSYRRWERIAEIFLQGKDPAQHRIFSAAIAVISPLTLSDDNCEMLTAVCRNRFAVIPTICPMAGTTSPYSMIGTLLQMNAENIFLAALVQMLSPGNPVLYHVEPSVGDMRTGTDLYYTHDKILWKLASIQLGKSYGLPTAATCGGAMGCRYDLQTGAEGILFMQSAIESGADILHGFGSFYNAMGMSPEMQLIQSSWRNAALLLKKGIDVSLLDESAESLKRVGPSGHFLADDFTVERLRSGEFFSDELYDLTGERHSDKGSMLEKAHAKVLEMTQEYRSPHSEKVCEELKDYFFRELYSEIMQ